MIFRRPVPVPGPLWKGSAFVLLHLLSTSVPVQAQLFMRPSLIQEAGVPPEARGFEEERGAVSRSILPFVIYNPETSLAVGALFARVLEDPGVPGGVGSSLLVSGQYTLKNQLAGSVTYESRPRAKRLTIVEGSLRLSWPDRFYLPGNRSGREEYEEWTSRGLRGRAAFLRRVGGGPLFLGPRVALDLTQILEVEEGGVLDRREVEGAETHGLAGLGLTGVWDSRDSPIYPRNGGYHTVALMGHGSFEGPGRWLVSLDSDLRRFFSLGPKTVLALRARARWATGDVPFTMHWGIGGMGGGLRGIYETRFADRTAWVGAAELRRALFWRLGVVVFAGAGEVASHPGELRLAGVHGAAGLGLRLALIPESNLNVGIDLAMGEGETNLYFLLGEVF